MRRTEGLDLNPTTSQLSNKPVVVVAVMAFHTNVTKAAFLHFAHPRLYHPIYLQVPAAFDFPQFVLILLFLLMTGVVKNATAVLFDPLNNSAGHTTIPAVYFFAALAPFVFFALCMLAMFKYLVSRLTPNLGSRYVTSRYVTLRYVETSFLPPATPCSHQAPPRG